jgi:hypothetical protein
MVRQVSLAPLGTRTLTKLACAVAFHGLVPTGTITPSCCAGISAYANYRFRRSGLNFDELEGLKYVQKEVFYYDEKLHGEH